MSSFSEMFLGLAGFPWALVVRVTVLLAGAWCLEFALRNANPRWRILLWRASALGIIAIATVGALEPMVTWRVLPVEAPPPVAAMEPTPWNFGNHTHTLDTPEQPTVPKSSSPTKPPSLATSPGESRALTESVNLGQKDQAVRETDQAGGFSAKSLDFRFWVIAMWLGGALVMLVRFAVGVRKVRQITGAAVPVSTKIRAIAQELSHRWGMKQTIDVRQSHNKIAPCTLGIVRPVVLLPTDMCHEAASRDLRSTLAHELCHIAGRDLPWNALLEVIAALGWFHPLVWRMRLAHADACDERCDAIVAADSADYQHYGRLLARVALDTAERMPTVSLPMARAPRVLRRIALLSTGRGRVTLRRSKAMLAVLLIVMAAALLGTTSLGHRVAEAAPPAVAENAVPSETKAAKAPTVSKSQLRGRITDETGAAVTDATVSLMGDKRGEGWHHETKTDATGGYAFDKIKVEDTYRLRVESKGWVGLTKHRDLPKLELSPTSDAVYDVTLARACRVRLRTVDAKGDPIPNAWIYPKNIAGDRFAYIEITTTDREGWAEIGGLAPAETEYLFGITSDKFAFGKLQLRLDDPGQVVEQTIVLEEGTDVQGIALCADDKPAAGWSVNALPEWWIFSGSPKGAEIGSAGEFTLPRIAAGKKYNITIGVPTGDGMTRVESVMNGVVLPPASGILEVRSSSPSPQSMGAISGKLLISGEASQDWISIDAVNEDDRRFNGHVRVRPDEPNFKIQPLPPGRYRIEVTSTEIETVTLRGIEAPREGLEIPVEVRGRPKFVGRVVDEAGAPVSKFRVRVAKLNTLRGPNYVQDSQWINVNDSEGGFSVNLVGPGIYRATVAVDGWAPMTSEPLNTDEPPEEPMTLKLSRGATLQGTVVDEKGKPIDGAVVAPRSASPQVLPQQAKAFAGEEQAVKTVGGKFELSGLPAGKELVRVTHSDYVFALSEEIDLSGGDVELPPITLRRGVTVRGTVYDAAGKPRANTTILFHDEKAYGGVYDEEVGRLATAVTDEDGKYVARHLPERLCYVHLAEEWDETGVVRTAIFPSEGKNQTLDFGGPGGVRGRLLVNGVPMANVRVQLGGEHAHFGVFKAFAITDEDGKFAFGRPPAGRHILWYQPEGRQSNWIRMGDVTFPAAAAPGELIDMGDVDSHGGTVAFDVAGVGAEELASMRVLLQTIDPHWFSFGEEVGNPVVREREDAPFAIQDVPPGDFEVTLVRSDNIALRTPITIQGGAEPQSATLTWPASTGTLVVNIAADFCDEQRCAPPKLRSVDGRVFGYLQPRPDGEPLKIAGLPAGDYYLTDQDVREAQQVLTLEISSGETTTIDVNTTTFVPRTDRSLGIARIHWFGANGIPLAGVEGSVENAGNVEELRITKRNAEWSIVGPPGDYVVVASFPGYPTKEIPVTIAPPGPDGRITGDVDAEYWFGD